MPESCLHFCLRMTQMFISESANETVAIKVRRRKPRSKTDDANSQMHRWLRHMAYGSENRCPPIGWQCLQKPNPTAINPKHCWRNGRKRKAKVRKGRWQKEKVSAALIRNGNETDEKQAHFRAATQMVPLEHASATRVSMPWAHLFHFHRMPFSIILLLNAPLSLGVHSKLVLSPSA